MENQEEKLIVEIGEGEIKYAVFEIYTREASKKIENRSEMLIEDA